MSWVVAWPWLISSEVEMQNDDSETVYWVLKIQWWCWRLINPHPLPSTIATHALLLLPNVSKHHRALSGFLKNDWSFQVSYPWSVTQTISGSKESPLVNVKVNPFLTPTFYGPDLYISIEIHRKKMGYFKTIWGSSPSSYGIVTYFSTFSSHLRKENKKCNCPTTQWKLLAINRDGWDNRNLKNGLKSQPTPKRRIYSHYLKWVLRY